ncbi:MAG TPA: ATP-binding cassette domain-containing protein, partial [Beutenbergiaceae bacterium]|nr:ATP-binding cassette domain-containing protein [Beutenbergiaceae bacterium]
SFSPLVSVTYVVTAVLCGASLGSGALLAGVATVFIPEVLQRVGLPVDLSTALLALGAFDVLRRGRGGIAEQLRDHLERRNHSSPPTSLNPQLPHAASHTQDHRGPGLEIANLRVQFGKEPALDGVRLAVGPGEVHAMVGANGAGKTSFIDAVSGFLPQATGSIMVEGRPLETLLAHQRATAGIRRTFQHTRAIDELTIRQYLRLARARGPRTTTDLDLYAVFSLPEPTTRITTLTLSQRRVVEVAAVFAAQPQVALLDEPAAGLSELEKAALASVIRNAPGLFGCSVLLIEHDPDFIRDCGAQVWTLSEGKIIDQAPNTQQPEPSGWEQTNREQEEPWLN